MVYGSVPEKEKRKEKEKTAEEDERRGRGQATQGVTLGRLSGWTSEGVTLMLLTPPLQRKV